MAKPTPYTVETHTAGDGYCWRYRRYPPALRGEVRPRAYLVCIHGIQSHAGWYEYSSGRLAEAGFEVLFVDRRGSGMNEQARGDTPNYVRLVEDLEEFLAELRTTTPPFQHAPVFLLAISWGGKLAVALQSKQPELVDGLVLLCPGFFARIMPSLKQRLRIAWARLVAPRRSFAIPLNDPELFTATRSWQHFIAEDVLSLHQATARFLVESARLDRYLRSAPSRVSVPVLLLLAERDRIIDNARTRTYVEQFASTDKEIIEYAGTHHTLEFEPEPNRFVGDLLLWLDRQCMARM